MMRAFSRIFVPARHRADPRYEEDFATRVILAVSFRVALLLLIPSLIAVGFTGYEARQRSQDNRERIVEANAARKELVRGFKRADVLACRSIENLKEQNRADARETFGNLERTLRILRVENTPEVQAFARENLQADLARNEAREGGCGKLPRVR